MTQNSLNYCMILNTYKKDLDEVILTDVVKKFCRECEVSLNRFGKFSDKEIPQQFWKMMSVAALTF